MSKFQHDVMLRIVKILNVLMIELPFAACWFLYYSHQTYANLAWKGHFAILGLFFILYIALGKVYDAFWMSMQRVSELVYGQILGAMATDGILYIVICLMSAKICNLLPGIAAIVGQLVMAAIWASCAHKWYYTTFPPQKTAVVYDVRHGMEKLINEYGLSQKYDVQVTLSVSECLEDLSILDEMETVFVSGVHSHERNIILKHCVGKGINMFVIPRVGDVIMSGAWPMHMFHLPMLRVGRYMASPEFLFVKRAMDIVISLVALVILSPVLLITAMHDMFNMDGASKFHFDWKDLVKSGLSAKDAIAPTAFAFKNSRTFQMGGIFCAASFLSITASDISDQLLKDFLDMDSSQIVTMHIQSVDQNRAIKTVKRTITELDRSKIEEQKKAIRAGYDIDIIPSDLATYGRDAKALLKELQSQNERMFLVTFLVLNTGRTEQELENNVFQASSIAQKHNCNLCRLDFQQEQGLMSSLPLADCQIEIQRGLTTSSTAIFIPFTTQELYQSGKESLYYGLNALSNNLIMVDRKKLKNPNGLILGTPGSGKSFSAKREIANAFLVTDDDIIINDPEGEYSPLVNRLKGQVIKISPNSTQFVNPMDINANYSEEDNPLSLKADFILSLCELVVGGKEGLLPVEKTVIDRCVHLIYRKYFADPCPENMPILEDLYNALLQQDEKEAHHVATALEIYVKGSLNLFNHRTNVNVNNRIVCYDIKELGKQMKKLGMLIVQDQVWGRVTANRSSGKSTRYYMDEMHLLLKEEQTAAYSVEIWKRFRKWGGIPTGLTQNVKDLLSSREVENIFENSDMIIMLNQAAGDRQILAKQLNISPHQLSYVTHSGEGEGLLFFGNVILPFVDRFPTDLELYRIMTTKLGEVSEGAQK